MINSQLTHLEKEAARICARLRKLEEVSVKDAAALLKKSPRWVRSNFPIVIHGPRSRHIKISDIEEYQARRTVRPQNGVVAEEHSTTRFAGLNYDKQPSHKPHE